MKEKNTKMAIVTFARHDARIVDGVLKHKTPYSGDMHGWFIDTTFGPLS